MGIGSTAKIDSNSQYAVALSEQRFNPLFGSNGCLGCLLLICFVPMLQVPHAESFVGVIARYYLLDVHVDGDRHPQYCC